MLALEQPKKPLLKLAGVRVAVKTSDLRRCRQGGPQRGEHEQRSREAADPGTAPRPGGLALVPRVLESGCVLHIDFVHLACHVHLPHLVPVHPALLSSLLASARGFVKSRGLPVLNRSVVALEQARCRAEKQFQRADVNGGVNPRISGEQRASETTRCRAGHQEVASRQAASRLLRCAPALRVT